MADLRRATEQSIGNARNLTVTANSKSGETQQANKEGQQRKVQLLTETAKCESMLGDVRGRGSNSPTYSIIFICDNIIMFPKFVNKLTTGFF